MNTTIQNSRVEPENIEAIDQRFPNFRTIRYIQENHNNDESNFKPENKERMTVLNLSYNKFVNLEDCSSCLSRVSVFKGMNNLLYLNLKGNQIRHIDENCFDSNKQLQYLDLSDNCIKDRFCFNSLRPLTKLMKLDISGNQAEINIEQLIYFIENSLKRLDVIYANQKTVLGNFKTLSWSPLSSICGFNNQYFVEEKAIQHFLSKSYVTDFQSSINRMREKESLNGKGYQASNSQLSFYQPDNGYMSNTTRNTQPQTNQNNFEEVSECIQQFKNAQKFNFSSINKEKRSNSITLSKNLPDEMKITSRIGNLNVQSKTPELKRRIFDQPQASKSNLPNKFSGSFGPALEYNFDRRQETAKENQVFGTKRNSSKDSYERCSRDLIRRPSLKRINEARDSEKSLKNVRFDSQTNTDQNKTYDNSNPSSTGKIPKEFQKYQNLKHENQYPYVNEENKHDSFESKNLRPQVPKLFEPSNKTYYDDKSYTSTTSRNRIFENPSTISYKVYHPYEKTTKITYRDSSANNVGSRSYSRCSGISSHQNIPKRTVIHKVNSTQKNTYYSNQTSCAYNSCSYSSCCQYNSARPIQNTSCRYLNQAQLCSNQNDNYASNRTINTIRCCCNTNQNLPTSSCHNINTAKTEHINNTGFDESKKESIHCDSFSQIQEIGQSNNDEVSKKLDFAHSPMFKTYEESDLSKDSKVTKKADNIDQSNNDNSDPDTPNEGVVLFNSKDDIDQEDCFVKVPRNDRKSYYSKYPNVDKKAENIDHNIDNSYLIATKTEFNDTTKISISENVKESDLIKNSEDKTSYNKDLKSKYSTTKKLCFDSLSKKGYTTEKKTEVEKVEAFISETKKDSNYNTEQRPRSQNNQKESEHTIKGISQVTSSECKSDYDIFITTNDNQQRLISVLNCEGRKEFHKAFNQKADNINMSKMN